MAWHTARVAIIGGRPACNAASPKAARPANLHCGRAFRTVDTRNWSMPSFSQGRRWMVGRFGRGLAEYKSLTWCMETDRGMSPVMSVFDSPDVGFADEVVASSFACGSSGTTGRECVAAPESAHVGSAKHHFTSPLLEAFLTSPTRCLMVDPGCPLARCNFTGLSSAGNVDGSADRTKACQNQGSSALCWLCLMRTRPTTESGHSTTAFRVCVSRLNRFLGRFESPYAAVLLRVARRAGVHRNAPFRSGYAR